MTPEEIAAKEAADAAAKEDADKAAADEAAKNNSGNTKTPEDLQAERDALQAERDAIQADRDAKEARLKELEAAEEARKTAELTSAEREKKRADDTQAALDQATARLRRREILDATKAAASALKVELDAQAVEDLYEAKAFDAVKLNSDGVPQGVETLLSQLITTKPYLVRPKPAAPETPATKTGKESSGAMTEERLADLKTRFRIK